MNKVDVKHRAVVVIGEDMVEHHAATMCAIAMAGMIHELQIPEFHVRKERHDHHLHIYYSDYAEGIIKDKKQEIENALSKRLDPMVVRKLMVTLFGFDYYQ